MKSLIFQTNNECKLGNKCQKILVVAVTLIFELHATKKYRVESKIFFFLFFFEGKAKAGDIVIRELQSVYKQYMYYFPKRLQQIKYKTHRINRISKR